jgi:uncharacterized membrane protein YgcG
MAARTVLCPPELAFVARALNLSPNMTSAAVQILTTLRHGRGRVVWSRVLLLASALFLALTALAHRAYAGTLQVRDEAHTLSAGDIQRLRSIVGGTPFDARLVVTTEYPQAQDLSRLVGSLVTEPDMVVAGLDPEHRHVQVHFGNGSHIPRGAWPAIEAAGNDAFRHGDWAGGAAAIFRAASGAVTSAPDDGRSTEVARPSLFGPVLLLVIVAGAIGIAVHFARRRAMYGSYGAQGYGPGPYPPGGYPPGYPMGPPQGGMGPVGGGLIGAGLGGLAGYELGKLEGEREGRDRDPGVGGGGASAPDDNFDAGGGGSSWDDGGGGGGFDGGGGDSGGGSDF